MLLSRVITQFTPNLHTLVLPMVADVHLLSIISNSAMNLKILDISLSFCVDDDAIINTIASIDQGNMTSYISYI